MRHRPDDIVSPRSASSSRRSRERGLRIEPLEPRILLHGGGEEPELTDHYHQHLSIFIDGENLDIPANVGVNESGILSEIHTHGDDGILHVHTIGGTNELDHLPNLGEFFDTWRTNAGVVGNNPDAIFNENEILGYQTGDSHTIRFFVNGVGNHEFDNYILRNSDQLVISYEEIVEENAPQIVPTGNTTMLSGQTLNVPIVTQQVGDDAITYTFSSNNPFVSSVMSPPSNRSLRLTVNGNDASDESFSGDLVFELFEDLVPSTTSRIIELVDQGFYDGLNFHRIIDGFMAQGGDPLGTGFGGTGLDFDDEFSELLTFTGFGQLAMANSGDDTNDSQFFITDPMLNLNMVSFNDTPAPPRHLNFNHAIFGQLVDGYDLMNHIMHVETESSDRPVQPITIEYAEVFHDFTNATLRLYAQDNFTGYSDITVTATDANGTTDTHTFEVEIIEDTINDRPFLAPVSDLTTTEGTPVTFSTHSTDLENDTLSLVVRDINNFNEEPTGVFVITSSTTGEVTLVPDDGVTGELELVVGVRDDTNRGGSLESKGQFDTQVITLTVVDTNNPPTGSSTSHNVHSGQPESIQLEGDDGDVTQTQSLFFSILDDPQSGTIQDFIASEGILTYIAAADFTGTDSFIYQVTDDEGAISEPATVTLYVTQNGDDDNQDDNNQDDDNQDDDNQDDDNQDDDNQDNMQNRSEARIRKATLRGKVLRIKGSRHADTIEIDLNETDDRLLVRLNSRAEQSFRVSDVRKIKIWGRRGDDVIHFDEMIPTRAYVNGGSGDDTIQTGAGNDKIRGSRGKDLIYPGSGHDRIRGSRRHPDVISETPLPGIGDSPASSSNHLTSGNATDIVEDNDHTASAAHDISTDGVLHGDRSDWTSSDDIPHILSENENPEAATAGISSAEDFGDASDLTANADDDEDSLEPVSDSHQEPASDNVSSEGLSFGDRSGSSSHSHDDDQPHIL